MKASELVYYLQGLIAEFGDQEIFIWRREDPFLTYDIGDLSMNSEMYNMEIFQISSEQAYLRALDAQEHNQARKKGGIRKKQRFEFLENLFKKTKQKET